jgi:Flp pilus assembly protein TadG
MKSTSSRAGNPALTFGRCRDERGSIVVEFSLASILFFITMFGIIEFGRAIWEFNIVANVTKEGARWASVRGSTSAAPIDSPQATAANIKAYVQARSYGATFALSCTASAGQPACVNVTWPDGSNAPGNRVEVNVQKRFTPLTGLIPNSALTLQSTAQMVILK